jgi:hypothetical protein
VRAGLYPALGRVTDPLESLEVKAPVKGNGIIETRNEAQKRAGKQSAMDELKFCGKMNRSDSNWNLAEAATSSLAVSWESSV